MNKGEYFLSETRPNWVLLIFEIELVTCWQT